MEKVPYTKCKSSALLWRNSARAVLNLDDVTASSPLLEDFEPLTSDPALPRSH